MMFGDLGLKIRQVPAMEATKTIFLSVSNPVSRRGNRVLGILTLREVQHLEDANLIPREAMEVRYSVLGRIVLSVAKLIVESANMALISASVGVRVDT